MFAEATPVAVLNRGSDTPEQRNEARRVLRNAGCQYVRFEARPFGAMAALGFLSEGPNVEAL